MRENNSPINVLKHSKGQTLNPRHIRAKVSAVVHVDYFHDAIAPLSTFSSILRQEPVGNYPERYYYRYRSHLDACK